MSLRSLFKKELLSFLNTPTAYIVTVIFLLVPGIWFLIFRQFLAADTASLRGYFNIFPLSYIIVVPALTMRSWAEERRRGTEEHLFSLPFSEIELVLGKYFASVTILAIKLFITLPLTLGIVLLGPFDPGQIFGEYLGAFLLGAFCISVGQCVSSITLSQTASFLISGALLLSLMLLGDLNLFLRFPGFFADFLVYLSPASHFDSFSKGILDSRDILYYIFFTIAVLSFNGMIIRLRKWR